MSATQNCDAIERRREKRQHVRKAIVKLDAGNGAEPIACFVWDISEHGARLKLSVATELSKVVYVIIGNVRKAAAVVWRKGDHVGLEFFPE
jgi:hypothetical protein